MSDSASEASIATYSKSSASRHSAYAHNTRKLQDDGHSMWSRPFNFGGKQVRVEEGWGIGIGEPWHSSRYASIRSCHNSLPHSGGTVWEGGVLLAQYLR